MQPPNRRVHGLLRPILRRFVATESDHDPTDGAALDAGSNGLVQPREPLLEGRKDRDRRARRVRTGVQEGGTGLGLDPTTDLRGLAQAGLDSNGLTFRHLRQDPSAEQRPEALHLTRDDDRLVEEGPGVLHVAVVDPHVQSIRSEGRRAGAHHRLEPRIGLLHREQDLRRGHVSVGKVAQDPVELVQTHRRLARRRVPGKRRPERLLDVVDRRPVLSALGEVGERERELLRRAVGPRRVGSPDDHGGFAAEGLGHQLQQPGARLQIVQRDPSAVRKLTGERIVRTDEHQRGLAGGALDVRGVGREGQNEPRGLESHASTDLRKAPHAVRAGRDPGVDPIGDFVVVGIAQQAVGRIEGRKIEVGLVAPPGTPLDGARGRRRGSGRQTDDACRGFRRCSPGIGRRMDAYFHRAQAVVSTGIPTLRVGELFDRDLGRRHSLRGHRHPHDEPMETVRRGSYTGLRHPELGIPDLSRVEGRKQIAPDVSEVGARERSGMRERPGKESGGLEQAVVVPTENREPADAVDRADDHRAFTGVQRRGIPDARECGAGESLAPDGDPDLVAGRRTPRHGKVHPHGLEAQPGGNLGRGPKRRRRRCVAQQERRVDVIGNRIAVLVAHQGTDIEERRQVKGSRGRLRHILRLHRLAPRCQRGEQHQWNSHGRQHVRAVPAAASRLPRCVEGPVCGSEAGSAV